MKNILLVIGLFVSTVALARPDYPNVSGTIFGGWNAFSANQNGFKIDLKLYFGQNNTVLAASTCTYQGQTLTVETSSPMVLTKDTVTITSSNQAEKSINGVKCNVAIQAATMGYVVNGDNLTMSAGGQSMTVTRSQE